MKTLILPRLEGKTIIVKDFENLTPEDLEKMKTLRAVYDSQRASEIKTTEDTTPGPGGQ